MLKRSLGLYRQVFSVKSSSPYLNFRKLSRVNMVKDIFIVDTRCHLNKSISKAFTKLGYEAKVSRISSLHLPIFFSNLKQSYYLVIPIRRFRGIAHLFSVLLKRSQQIDIHNLCFISLISLFSGCYWISWCPG